MVSLKIFRFVNICSYLISPIVTWLRTTLMTLIPQQGLVVLSSCFNIINSNQTVCALTYQMINETTMKKYDGNILTKYTFNGHKVTKIKFHGETQMSKLVNTFSSIHL